MKQRWILGIIVTLLAVFFISCTDFFEQEEEVIPTGGVSGGSSVMVYFDNAGNNCSVDVFANGLRERKITTVASKVQSNDIDWEEAAYGFEFYYTYNIPVSGLSIPYTNNRGFVTASISRGRTKVIVKPLSEIVGSNEPLFPEDILISIRNNNSTAIRLQTGDVTVIPESGTSLINGGGGVAFYKLASGANVSNYKITLDYTTKIDLPIIAFQNGYLYEITFNNANNISLQSKLLTLSSLNL